MERRRNDRPAFPRTAWCTVSLYLCGGHISPIFVSAGPELESVIIDTRHEVTAVFAGRCSLRTDRYCRRCCRDWWGPGVTNHHLPFQECFTCPVTAHFTGSRWQQRFCGRVFSQGYRSTIHHENGVQNGQPVFPGLKILCRPSKKLSNSTGRRSRSCFRRVPDWCIVRWRTGVWDWYGAKSNQSRLKILGKSLALVMSTSMPTGF